MITDEHNAVNSSDAPVVSLITPIMITCHPVSCAMMCAMPPYIAINAIGMI